MASAIRSTAYGCEARSEIRATKHCTQAAVERVYFRRVHTQFAILSELYRGLICMVARPKMIPNKRCGQISGLHKASRGQAISAMRCRSVCCHQQLEFVQGGFVIGARVPLRVGNSDLLKEASWLRIRSIGFAVAAVTAACAEGDAQ